MDNLEPITRNEMLLNGDDLTPITREEMILAGADLEPLTRHEWFLKKYRGGGDVTIERLAVTENGTYSESGKAYSPVVVNVPAPENAYLLNDLSGLPADIATFTDGTDLPMASLKVAVTPYQDLSHGDPSPENICPIIGWDEVNVYDDAVYGGTVAWNQLISKMRISGSEKGLTFTRNVDGSLDISGTVTEAFEYNYISFTITNVRFERDGRKYLIMLNKPIPYVWGINGYGGHISANSIGGMWSNNIGTDWNNGLIFRAEVGTTIDIQNLRAMVFDLTQMFGETKADEIYAMEQAETGSGVAYFKSLFYKDYYPYNSGEITNVSAVNGDTDKYFTYKIDLDGTRYGGTLDATNGVLTVDRVSVDLGTLTWNRTTSYSVPMFYATVAGKLISNISMLCSVYKFSGDFGSAASFAQSGENGSIGNCHNNEQIFVRDDSYTDATTFKTAMQGVQLVYELATHVTVQLAPTAIKSLVGTNNIFANCGQITEGKYFKRA